MKKCILLGLCFFHAHTAFSFGQFESPYADKIDLERSLFPECEKVELLNGSQLFWEKAFGEFTYSFVNRHGETVGYEFVYSSPYCGYVLPRYSVNGTIYDLEIYLSLDKELKHRTVPSERMRFFKVENSIIFLQPLTWDLYIYTNGNLSQFSSMQ